MAKGAYSGVGGVARKVKTPYVGVANVARKVKNGYVGVGGVARQFYSGGKPLSEYTEGDVVLIPENGTNVEFYVAKHDYESGLNGAGRTLLVRKAYYNKSAWCSNSSGKYAGSTVDTLLNGTYKSLFSGAVQTAIGTTKIYSVKDYSANAATALERAIFLLSATEYGLYNENNPSAFIKEGSTLSVASTLRSATTSPKNPKWTRTIVFTDLGTAIIVNSSGAYGGSSPTVSNYVHPAFTLPKATMLNPETNVILL